jgi:predicted amidohydrolase YtcJ
MDHLDTEVVLVGARVRTMRDPDDVHDALAIRGSRIAAVGDEASVRARVSSAARVVNAGGATLLPGFIDTHVHIEDSILFDWRLEGARSRAEVLARVRAVIETTPDDEWLVIGGTILDPQVWPTAADLAGICRGRNVVLAFSSGVHSFSPAALDRINWAGVRSEHADVETDESGTPTGIVRMRGVGRLHYIIPTQPTTTSAAVRSALTLGLRELAKQGVTSFHHMITNRIPVQIYQEMYANGELSLRVGLLTRVYESEISLDSIIETGLAPGFGNEYIRFQGVKVSIDGYFPQGGALFSEPYEGTCSCGYLRIGVEEFTDLVMRAHAAGLRICVHSNGDQATRHVLDAFAQAISAAPARDHRHRVEHAGNIYLPPEMVKEFAELRLVAVPNPTFMHSTVSSVTPRLGQRRGRHPLNVRQLLDAGVTVGVGSDFPALHPGDPLIGMAALIDRRSLSGSVYAPEESIEPWEALSLYTRRNAWLSFEERDKGTLESGKLADIAVLPCDPMEAGAETLRSSRVLATMVGGRWVHVGDEDHRFTENISREITHA